MEVLGNDNFIGNSLRQYGEWAQAELDTLLPLIKEGAFVADVGANIGTHTLAFARAVGKSGLVVAYEPQEKIANILQRNVDRNLDGYHIEVVAAACAERHGTIDVPSPDYCRERNFGAISLIKESGIDKFDTVPTVLVDDAFSRRGRKADLIKIDVEGMEDSVLYGARETIKNSRPILFVENNTKDRSAQTIASIRDVTENYVLYWHIAQYYNPDNFSGNKTNVFARFRPEANILAIPNEKWDSGVCDILSEDGHLTPVFSDTETWEDAVRRIQDIAA
jgi:FkbM family methyltransferase